MKREQLVTRLQRLRFGIIHPKSIDRNRLHYLIFQRSVLEISSRLGNFVYVFHTFNHFPKRRISAVQVRTHLVHDEEVWKLESL